MMIKKKRTKTDSCEDLVKEDRIKKKRRHNVTVKKKGGNVELFEYEPQENRRQQNRPKSGRRVKSSLEVMNELEQHSLGKGLLCDITQKVMKGCYKKS